MIYDNKAIAKRLRNRRKELNLTVADVAEGIGRTPRYYGDIERGSCGMSVETLIALANFLDLSADYILTGGVDPERGTALYAACNLLKKHSAQVQERAVKLLRAYLSLEHDH